MESDTIKDPLSHIGISFSDTLRIDNTSPAGSATSMIERNMPWIGAIIIGILTTGVNIFIAISYRRSNERNLRRQIDATREIALTEFKATINTKNRQEWINELRHSLSDFMSYSLLLIPTMEIAFDGSMEKNALLTKLMYSKAKIELLLNNKDEQKDLTKAIHSLLDSLSSSEKGKFNMDTYTEARGEVVRTARKLFIIHWAKIKDLK